MAEIKYVKGDATEPIGEGKKLLVHVCNDIGAWGAGFVLALSAKWKEPEESYRKWNKAKHFFELGFIQRVPVEEDITVVNMIAQRGLISTHSIPVRYPAVRECLRKVADEAKEQKATVHMPRIGCGLAGGSWDIVEGIIKETLINRNIEVVVYDFD